MENGMKIAYEIITDILLYGGQGLLFFGLLYPVLEEHPSPGRRRTALAVSILPFFLLRIMVTHSPRIQRLLYGEQMQLKNSRDTIISALLSFLVLLISGLVLYWKWRMQVLFLTLIYTAFSEMLRFGIYCLTIWYPNLFIAILNKKLLEKSSIALADYYFATAAVQVSWNLLFFSVYLLGMYLALRRYRRYLVNAGRRPSGYELLYLIIPALTALCFGLLLRSILLIVRDGKMYHIFDTNRALYGVIPAIALLCVFLMLASVQLRCRLIEEEEEKSRLALYQSRVEDMEGYIRDMEGMQDGIRGMKHDMKNYVADIQALLKLQDGTKDSSRDGQAADRNAEGEPEQAPEQAVRWELEQYLRGLEQTLGSFEFHWKTGNSVTDVILNRFLQRAGQAQITTDCEFFFPKESDIDPFDMSIILNNGLNNALEACQGLEKEKRWITLKSSWREKVFLLELLNPIAGSVEKKAGSRLFATTKPEKEGHGYGLENISNCVKKYHGYMECSAEDGVFRLTVMLQSPDFS